MSARAAPRRSTNRTPPPAGQDAGLIRLCEQHIGNVRGYGDDPDLPPPPDDPDPLGDAMDATRDAILETPAQTISGVLAKARLAVQQAEIDRRDDDWDSSDAGTWAREVTLDLLRLYGELTVDTVPCPQPEDHGAVFRDAAYDLMMMGEIAERLGAVGTNDDSDSVPATWLEWLGKQVSLAAGQITSGASP